MHHTLRPHVLFINPKKLLLKTHFDDFQEDTEINFARVATELPTTSGFKTIFHYDKLYVIFQKDAADHNTVELIKLTRTHMERPSGYEKILKSIKVRTYPEQVILELINKCNLNCIMCPQDKISRPQGTMQEHLYKKIIDDLAAQSPETTELWLAIMGEALLLKNVALQRIEYAIQKGLKKVFLNTNLACVDESIVRKLIHTGVHKIIVGLDAATSDTYNKIRVGGDFNKVLLNIDFMLDEMSKLDIDGPELIIQFIVQENNKHELEAFKKLFAGKPVTLKIRKQLGWGTGVEAPELKLKQDRDYPCPWLSRSMSIHCTGQVAQCDAAWDGIYYYGDMNFQTIGQVWHGKLAEIRNRHLNLDFDFAPCRDCDDWQCGLSETFYPEKQ